jgi:hypothetical protein
MKLKHHVKCAGNSKSRTKAEKGRRELPLAKAVGDYNKYAGSIFPDISPEYPALEFPHRGPNIFGRETRGLGRLALPESPNVG